MKTTAPVFDEVCETTGVTLTRFMIEVASLNPELAELPSLFSGIETACKAISSMVKRSQLTGTVGYMDSGDINIQGEEQKKLDVMTNEVLKSALRFTGRMGVIASEEEDVPVDVKGIDVSKDIMFDETAKYTAVFDPLDGSSNVDAGIPTGTIFGIFEHDDECEVDASDSLSTQELKCLTNTLKAGTSLVSSGYCLYSSSCFFVVTFGSGVYGFTLDENIGEFVLTHPKIMMPVESKIYSFNEANLPQWDEPMRETVEKWREGKGKSGNSFSSRYIGSMVGDVHRTLLYGGVFGYPSDKKNVNGKLRLLYEGAPMSFLIEQAGGMSSTGRNRVMEIFPDQVHIRVPIIMGSKNDVQEVVDAYTAWNGVSAANY